MPSGDSARDTEIRCSECNRPALSEPCGFTHALMIMQVKVIRDFGAALLRRSRESL